MAAASEPSTSQLRDQFATAVKTGHSEIFEISDKLSSLAETFLRTIQIREDDGLSIVKGCLLLRLISGLQALTLLASQGFYTEALGQKRSLLEALARLAALSKDPSLFEEYLMQDALNRVKLLGDIIEFRKNWDKDLPRIPSDEELESTIADVKASIDRYNNKSSRNLRDIKTFDWAAKGEVDHLLLGHYVISSQSLHHAPRDLERQLVIAGEKLKGISVGPERSNIAPLILDSCKLVFVGIQWFANSLNVELPEDIQALYLHYEATYERLALEAIQDN